MLLAIDVGNTQTVYGVWDGSTWLASWRRATNVEETEDQIAAWLYNMFALAGLPFEVGGAICGSVVPAVNEMLGHLAAKWLHVPLLFLRTGDQVGLEVSYTPPNAVGPDRLANALGALATRKPPIIVVDFGTATTFDCIDRHGVYVGGSILPGITVAAQALVGRTARLPAVEFVAPKYAVGKTTVESIQSGLMLGYSGAIDAIATKIEAEMGVSTILATGGLGSIFLELCQKLTVHEPFLTLDGLRIAYDRLKDSR